MESPISERSVSLRAINCLIFIFCFFPTNSIEPDEPTAYDVLEKYNFPRGILPEGVVGYDLDESTGRFSAYLNGSCSFPVEGYQLSYQPTIKGYISKDNLSSLSGVKVKWLFLWVEIAEVYRSGDRLEFSVGIASDEFSVDNFEECPQCGCGFSCNCDQCLNNSRRSTFAVKYLPLSRREWRICYGTKQKGGR